MSRIRRIRRRFLAETCSAAPDSSLMSPLALSPLGSRSPSPPALSLVLSPGPGAPASSSSILRDQRGRSLS